MFDTIPPLGKAKDRSRVWRAVEDVSPYKNCFEPFAKMCLDFNGSKIARCVCFLVGGDVLDAPKTNAYCVQR